MLTPKTLDVVLDCGAEWAEIVKSGYTSIDFERGGNEELALKEVFNLSSTVLFREICIHLGLLLLLKKVNTLQC